MGLARMGAAVIVSGRTEAAVAEAIGKIAAAVPTAKTQSAPFDLGTVAGCSALTARFPEVDILVNSLGIYEPKPFFEIPDEDWARMFEVNVMSGVRLSRHYAQGMARRGWGRVQFISSESALQIPAEMVQYGTTKTAQLAVSRGLAETLAGTGVTVNAVLPGPTRSEGVGGFFGKIAAERGVSQETVERDFIATHRPTSLIRRLASVKEVANLCVYLASEQASATTGAAMRVDGGVVRSIA
jgi:NAD(P)-dependent dehydrogenase (short-subunit alcohol dehydrogenase family)